MDDGYFGEIRMFAGNFVPRNWAICDGSILSVADNEALFSLLGDIYGGDGRTNFCLPDFRGRIPVGTGAGAPGLTQRFLGQLDGNETSQLSTSNLPSHTHVMQAAAIDGNSKNPYDTVLSMSPSQVEQEGNVYTGQNTNFTAQGKNLVPMNPLTVSQEGGNNMHYNMQPFLGINYIICTNGLYPTRNN